MNTVAIVGLLLCVPSLSLCCRAPTGCYFYAREGYMFELQCAAAPKISKFTRTCGVTKIHLAGNVGESWEEAEWARLQEALVGLEPRLASITTASPTCPCTLALIACLLVNW